MNARKGVETVGFDLFQVHGILLGKIMNARKGVETQDAMAQREANPEWKDYECPQGR